MKYTHDENGTIYEQMELPPSLIIHQLNHVEELYSDLEAARARIAELEAACQSLREESDGYLKQLQLRFNVTAADMQAAWENPKEQRNWVEFAMDYLADHAVIDVPPGVQSVDELRAELESSQTPDPPAELEDALAKIIRDAWNTDFTWSTTARAAIAFLHPVTWRDVEAKCKELVGRHLTSNHDDLVDLMDWLRANLPGGEG